MIVTATGLKMVPFGGISLSVDGSEVQLPDALVYRGMLVTGVPNMAFAFGYVNQSWTLGSDLACQQVCRMLRHMDENGYTHCTPIAPGGRHRLVAVRRAQLRLRPARDAPVPAPGVRRPVAPAPELRARLAPSAPDPRRRRSARLLDDRRGANGGRLRDRRLTPQARGPGRFISRIGRLHAQVGLTRRRCRGPRRRAARLSRSIARSFARRSIARTTGDRAAR